MSPRRFLLLLVLLCLGVPVQAKDDAFKAQIKAMKQKAKLEKQEQRRKERERRKNPASHDSRMDQILRPNTDRSFNLMKEKSADTSAAKLNTRSNRTPETTKKPWLPQKFNSKTYLTGGYRDSKSFWMGDFQYTVGAANTASRASFTDPSKKYQTKATPVKDAPDVRNYSDSALTLPTKDFRGGGAFTNRDDFRKFVTPLTPEQAANNGYKGELVELKSIDDIRELLNKSK